MRLVHPLDADAFAPDVVGRLGSCLGRLASLDLRVTPGFALGTAAWHLDRLCGDDWGLPTTVFEQVQEALSKLDPAYPLWIRPSPVHGSAAARPARRVTPDELEFALHELLSASPAPIAVVVQSRRRPSGTGIALTRDPEHGAVWPTGEFRTPEDAMDLDAFSHWMPQVALELRGALARIEALHRSVCEVAFSLAAGSLWFDDVRPLRHSRAAASRLAESGLTRRPAAALGS